MQRKQMIGLNNPRHNNSYLQVNNRFQAKIYVTCVVPGRQSYSEFQ